MNAGKSETLSVTIITLFPDFIRAYMDFGVLRSAISQSKIHFDILALRDFAVDDHGSVDAPPYGGGDGMVLRCEPLVDALAKIPKPRHVILASASGKQFTCHDAERLSLHSTPLVFICGRFAGVDQRFIDAYVDEEISIGDYVVSGGELPTLIMTDAIARFIPGVLGNSDSCANDSFASGLSGLLEYPIYTRPRDFLGAKVPEVLLSGDHAKIEAWRKEMSLQTTRIKRPDLLSHLPKKI